MYLVSLFMKLYFIFMQEDRNVLKGSQYDTINGLLQLRDKDLCWTHMISKSFKNIKLCYLV